MRLLFIFPIALTLTYAAQARPVSFVGGKTVIVTHDAKETSSLLHYTVNPKTSIGLRSSFRNDFRMSINAVEVNHLAYRDNGEDHQANLYIRGGIGISKALTERPYAPIKPVAYAGILADWEDRRRFISYENKFETINGEQNQFKQSARVGFAPYVADYGKLHTWLMLEVNHHPSDAEGPFTVRPLVRFFKGVHLLEVGINNRKEAMVNYIARY